MRSVSFSLFKFFKTLEKLCRTLVLDHEPILTALYALDINSVNNKLPFPTTLNHLV